MRPLNSLEAYRLEPIELRDYSHGDELVRHLGIGKAVKRLKCWLLPR